MLTGNTDYIYDNGFLACIYSRYDSFDETSSTKTLYRMPILQLPSELLLKITIPEWKLECYEQLVSISQLKDNWNDNGAKPFSKGLLEKTKDILDSLSYEVELFPTAKNTIQLECNNKDGDYLEFEIYEDKIKEFRLWIKDNENETKIIDSCQINETLKEFYGF